MFSRYLRAGHRAYWSVGIGAGLAVALLVLSVLALRWQFAVPRLGLGLEEAGAGEALVTSVHPGGSAHKAGVQVGDTLRSVGRVSLSEKDVGVERTTIFQLDVVNEHREGEEVEWEVIRDGERERLSGSLVGLPNSLIRSRAVVLGVFWLIGCVLLWARPRQRQVRHLVFTIFALTASVLFLANRRMAVDTPLGFALHQAHDIGSFFAPAMVIHFGVIFPICTFSDRVRRRVLWTTYGFYFLAVFLVGEILFFRAFFSAEAPYTLLPPALEAIHYGVIAQWLHIANYLVCGLFMYVTWRRVEDRTLQNQIKWVLWAVLLTGGIDLLANAVVLYYGGLSAGLLYPARNYLYLLIAGGLLVSVFRHDLFDVDAVIRQSVIYFSTTALLLVVFAGAQEGAERVLSRFIPAESSTTSNWAAAALTAGLFEPIRSRIKARVRTLVPGSDD